MEKIKKLGEPSSYYVGSPGLELVMPENILLLGRYSERLPSRRDTVHHRFLLAVNLKGKGSAIVDSVRHSLPSGHCFLIFPHQYHHFFYESDDINWIFVTFEMRETGHIEKLRNNTLAISSKANAVLEMLVDSYDDSRRLDANESAKVILLTKLLLTELMKSEKFAEKTPRNFIDDVNKYIYANLHRPLSIAELAKKFSYSPSHFRAVYRKEMGISAGRYIKEMKLHKAQSYLGTTDMSVGEIAEACGYDSLYSFSHAFKNYTKISPVEFRQKMIS